MNQAKKAGRASMRENTPLPNDTPREVCITLQIK